MRRAFFALAAAVVSLAASPAQAQFANKSIGFSLGYMRLFNDQVPIDYGIPIGIEGSLYIENGFDVLAHFQAMVVNDRSTNTQLVGIAPTVGVRYLFSEESTRPYGGADVSFLHIFGTTQYANFVGLGPNVGVDHFVSDSVTLGLRVQYNLYLGLNTPVEQSLGASALVATWF